MSDLRIRKIEVQGFRAFGQELQTLEFGSPIAVVWGPNSQGKTSLAEAFEFLLTGEISRRELMASSQDEFANALRNAHMPEKTQVLVRAEFVAPNGLVHNVSRQLVMDYGKRQNCQSSLQIDGRAASEDDLVALGISLSQPPLRAPVLTQHTLGYLFSARPQDRANYFKALLEVADLGAFRNEVAGLKAEIEIPESPTLEQFRKAAAIPEASGFLAVLQNRVFAPSLPEICKALDASIRAVVATTGCAAPDKDPGLIESLEEILTEKRTAAFPVRGFEKKPLRNWHPPAINDFEKLSAYLTEREKVDEETRRLTSLFKEAMALPSVAEITEPIDCPLCASQASLTSDRIAIIRAAVSNTEAFRNAENDGQAVIAQMRSSISTLANQVSDALPRFFVYSSSARRARGFRLERLRALLPLDSQQTVTAWLMVL